MEQISNLIEGQIEQLRPTTTAEQRIYSRREQAARQKREQLKMLSNKLQTEATDHYHQDGSPITLNELIMDYWCQKWELDHLELHTYEEWLQKGHQVKRGEQALQIWGPKATYYKGQLLDENGKPIPDTGEAIEYCQVLNVFDITQTYHVENCR